MDNRHEEKCGTPCATSREEMKVRGKDKRKRKRSRSRSSSISSTSSNTTTSSSCSSSGSSPSSSSRRSSSGRDVPLRTTSYARTEGFRQTRKTRKSKEDVFRELLQSTDAADSESRAWMETINEKLRMESQERRRGQERMIKLMEDQTEILRSLIALQAEHIRAQHPL